MPYTAESRERYRFLVAGITGLVACSAGGLTGAVAGVAAKQQVADSPADSLTGAAPSRATRPVVWKTRPHRTVVSTQVIRVASTSGAVTPGTGSPVAAPAAVSSSSGEGSGSSGGGPGPSDSAPAPAPAPTSGS